MEEIGLVELANDVLGKLPGCHRVQHWKDITSSTFVQLYEGLFAEALPDVIRQPKGREDEIHNLQSVIDTLSLDILNTSLSHLSGEAIVSGNKPAIKSLLEVFAWLFDYILEKIGSETGSTDGGDQQGTMSALSELEDPDLVTPEVIDLILERELGRKDYSRITSRDNSRTSGRPRSSRSHRSGNSTAELIALGNTTSQDTSRNGSTMDRTADLIALGTSQYASHSPPKRGPRTDGKARINTLNATDILYSNGSSNGVNLRDTDRYLKTTGDLSAIRGADSQQRAGARSGYRPPSDVAGSGRVGSSLINSPTRSSGVGLSDLSTGPISDITDLTNDSRTGKETTADLIRESESLEQRLGLRSPYGEDTPTGSTPQHTTPGVDSSLASSVSYPRPIMDEPGMRSAEFAHIGAAPAIQTGIGHTDSLAASLPLGHQYHSFTHHLYHHYQPGGSHPTDRGLATAPARTAAPESGGKTTAVSTQITPGRFLGEDTSGLSDRLNSSAPVTKPGDPLTDRLSRTVPAKSTAAARPRLAGVKSYSYDNLRYLLQDTVDMSQAALATSPLRAGGGQKAASAVHLNDDLTDDELSHRLRETLQKLHSSEDSATDRSRTSVKARSHARTQDSRPATQSILSPKSKRPATERAHRKVSFLTSRATEDHVTTDSDITDRLHGSSESPMESPVQGRSAAPAAKPRHPSPRAAQYKAIYGKGAINRKVPQKTGKARPTADKRAVNRRAERVAKTADEYFQKYYGSQRGTPSPRHRGATRQDRAASPATPATPLTPTTDESLLMSEDRGARSRADSCDADYSGDFAAEIEEYKRQLRKRSKKVQFDDILDDSAPGHMGGIRRKLMEEEKKTRFRSEFLKDLYEQEIMEYEGGMYDTMKKLKTTSAETNAEYTKKVLNSPKVKKHQPGNKYRAPHQSVLLPKSKAHNRTVSQGRGRKRSSATASPATADMPDSEILPWLLEQFPYLHVSPESLHDMWRKSAKQLQVLSKTDQYVKAKKNRAQQEIEEAEQKQQLLAQIAKKEVKHNNTMREIEERRKQQQSVKASIRDKRQQHARVRKYYDEYHVRMRSKMLKKRSREEMIFKKLFDEGLTIQKDRIRDLRSYAKDQREYRAQKQRDQLESIENMYRDRFMMLAEALEQEKQDRVLKNKAQQQVLSSLNREFRKKTEKEIETIQDQIFRDEDDEYFRQIDADRLRQELNLARYKARV